MRRVPESDQVLRMPRSSKLRRLTPRSLRRKAVVSLTFDDGTADQLAAARLLARHGIAGTFYVNSNLIAADSARLDWSGVEEIAAAGHEIGGHTADHVDLSKASEEEARRQILVDRKALRARGHEVQSFAYPYGAFNAATAALVAAAGYSNARRAWGLAGDDDPARAATESLPPVDPFAIRTAPSLERTTTCEDLQRLVLQAEIYGGWLPLVFHGLGGRGDRYDLPESVFGAFIAWLALPRELLSVRPVGDVVRRR